MLGELTFRPMSYQPLLSSLPLVSQMQIEEMQTRFRALGMESCFEVVRRAWDIFRYMHNVLMEADRLRHDISIDMRYVEGGSAIAEIATVVAYLEDAQWDREDILTLKSLQYALDKIGNAMYRNIVVEYEHATMQYQGGYVRVPSFNSHAKLVYTTYDQY